MSKLQINLRFCKLINVEAAPRCVLKKGVLSKFTKSTGKDLCQGICFNKVDSDAGVFL